MSGSISTYKAVYLASALVQAGAIVDVILTAAAAQMVQPLSFQAITHRRVHTDLFTPEAEAEGYAGHVSLGKQADAILIAPATANTLAKLALGLPDNFLLTTCLAARGPIVVAPAMESAMWMHPATQGHVSTLRSRGVRIVGPESGYLASGASGVGRLADPEAILAELAAALSPRDLTGRRIVVSAGGTREAIDPVRYISNHSSGRMGYAVAEAAARRGAETILIHGPTGLPTPFGVRTRPVESAADMLAAILEELEGADALFMAAAVADYRPAEIASQKIKKNGDELVLRLVRNPDILEEVHRLGRRDLVVVGWAAETTDLVQHAREKLERKGLDLIVANPVPQTFGADMVEATLIDRHGTVTPLPPLSKEELADRLLDLTASRFAGDER